MGFSPPRALQADTLDSDARTALWNSFYQGFFWNSHGDDYLSFKDVDALQGLWMMALRRSIDTMSRITATTRNEFFAAFSNLKWYQVLDFIEMCAKVSPRFAASLNPVLESENVAYRLVGKEIVPLTNATEIAEVEAARARTGATTPLAGARAHIDSALEKLGQRPTPDVRNAIKEAVSAVEVVARQVAGEGDTLGAALKRLDVDINPALKLGLEKLYGWTNGPDGIRHAMMAEPNLGVEDARFMVVTCSAFVNYLIVKADRAGVRL